MRASSDRDDRLRHLLDVLTTRGDLDESTRQVLQTRLFPHVDALRRAQRRWKVHMLAASVCMLVALSVPAFAHQALPSSPTLCSVALAVALPAMVAVERRRQRRVASTMLLMRLLQHASTLGGDSAVPCIDGHRLRRGIIGLEVTAAIAKTDCVRQLSGEVANASLKAAGDALAGWIRSVGARVALAGPVEILQLRGELVQVAVALAGSGMGAAAAHASRLTPPDDRAGPQRRVAVITGFRLGAALLFLLGVRRLGVVSDAAAAVTLEAAIVAITLAAVAWLAVGADPRAILRHRWRRWAAVPDEA